MARFGDGDLERLLADPGIIRNRQKLVSTISNARRVLEIQRELGSFDASSGRSSAAPPLVNQLHDAWPSSRPDARERALSKALRKRGFGFVGPTICYAFMQSAGLVNDHLVTCPRATPS